MREECVRHQDGYVRNNGMHPFALSLAPAPRNLMFLRCVTVGGWGGNATHAKGTQTKQPQRSRRGQRQATGDTPPDLKIYIGLDKDMLMVAPFAIEENLFKVVLINCVLYFSLTTGSSYKTKQIDVWNNLLPNFLSSEWYYTTLCKCFQKVVTSIQDVRHF